jgi:hypothetical protein
MRLYSALLAVVTLGATSGCVGPLGAGGLLSQQSGLSPFTCEMVVTELQLAIDAVEDANDFYDYRALEVVFDMTGDGLDVYAASESGEGAEFLSDLADQADTIGDVFGQSDPDPDRAVRLIEEFIDSAQELNDYCD